MFFFNLFSTFATRRWFASSLVVATLIGIVVLSAKITGLSEVFARPYMSNNVFMWMAVGGVFVSLIAVGVVSFYMHSVNKKNEPDILPAALTLTAFMFIFSIIVSSFIYVPNIQGAVVVPSDDPAQAYALTPGEFNIVLPWQGDIYTWRDGSRGTRVSFRMAEYHLINVVIVYQGELADLYREWGSPQVFAEYWQQRCHQELDGLMASIDPETALESLESQCIEFMPIEQILNQMVEGRGVTFRLNI